MGFYVGYLWVEFAIVDYVFAFVGLVGCFGFWIFILFVCYCFSVCLLIDVLMFLFCLIFGVGGCGFGLGVVAFDFGGFWGWLLVLLSCEL